MNALEHEITEILSEPKFASEDDQSWWEVKVKADCYGKEKVYARVFNSKVDAEMLEVGDTFMA